MTNNTNNIIREEHLVEEGIDKNASDLTYSREKEILELKLRERKLSAQKKMAWVSIISMILFTIFLCSPFIETKRIDSLNDVIGLMYISFASIVGAYMGFNAYMSVKK